MNVLVTGGSGFIGINIAELISENRDHTVILYSRSRPPRQAMELLAQMPGKVVWEQGDVLDGERVRKVMETHGIDYVVHGAVITPNGDREREQMETIIQVNCMGTLGVLAAAKANQVRRFVYVSSVAVYGNRCQDKDLVCVDTEKNPSNTYEITKYATELFCQRYGRLHHMDVVSLRLGDVYGPWEYRSGVRDTMSAPCQAVLCALTGKRASMRKEGTTGWVYGRDTARAVLALLQADRLTQPVYNCGGADRWSIPQFCARLSRIYTGFQYCVNPEEEHPNVTFFSEKDNGMFDMEQLKEDTGFVPVYDLERGSEDYLAWLGKYPQLVTEVPVR